MDMLITTATSHDEQERGARVAVLPVASFEQHGGFLPLITDTIVGLSYRQAAQRLLRLIAATGDAVVLPRAQRLRRDGEHRC